MGSIRRRTSTSRSRVCSGRGCARCMWGGGRGSGGGWVWRGDLGVSWRRVGGAWGGAGVRVLAGRCREVERGGGWGVVRELFVGHLAGQTVGGAKRALAGAARFSLPVLGMGASEGGEDAADATALALQGLYWLAANLAAERPLLIVVDDVQWCDSPSLRWLCH